MALAEGPEQTLPRAAERPHGGAGVEEVPMPDATIIPVARETTGSAAIERRCSSGQAQRPLADPPMIDYFKLVQDDAMPLPVAPQPDPEPDTGEDLDACPAVSNCPDVEQ